jgi:hypothetical protein
MATQGLLTITINERTRCKIVTGSDGYNIPQLAEWVKSNPSHSIEDLWLKSKTLFGIDSLVLQTSNNKAIYEGEFDPPKCNEECLYYTKFEQPRFNPRWKYGIADYIEVVDVPQLT